VEVDALRVAADPYHGSVRADLPQAHEAMLLPVHGLVILDQVPNVIQDSINFVKVC